MLVLCGEEAVCPDGLFVPAVFRESDFYLNSLIRSCDIWAIPPSEISTKYRLEFCNKMGLTFEVR